MDSFKSYTERVIIPQPTVLGLRLHPFTLGHSMLLKSANSVFIVGGIEQLTIKDLIGELVFALLVCSTDYDTFLKEANSKDFADYVAGYVEALNEEIEAADVFNLYDKLTMFRQYIKDGTSTPYYYQSADSSSDISTNPVEIEQSIISTLMADCNYTRSECLNLPLTETLSAFLLYAHKQGTINLKSKQEHELEQRLKGKH